MEFFKYILFFILGCMSPFIVMILINTFYYRVIKKIKPIKKIGEPYKPIKLWYKLFIQFPRQFVLDKLTFDPNTFPYKGVWIFQGKQGKGKTISMCYILTQLKQTYPLLKIKTNYDYKYQDDGITHWKDIVFSNNGIYGEVDVIDEIQTWFNSMESKNFPPEMLQEISQQRKQRKVIMGSSQLFTRISKQIREQTYLIFTPICLFGCFNIVKVTEPIFDDSANVIQQKLKKVFCFVQTKELRDSYDTYKKIERLAKGGFKDECDQIRVNSDNNVNNYVYVENRVSKGGKK